MWESETELLETARRGDPAAIRALVAQLTPPIQYQVTAVLLSRAPRDLRGLARDEVHDLVQIVFVQLFDHEWRALRRWDPARGGLNTYVRQVARSTAMDHLRKASRRPWRERFSADGTLESLVSARSPAFADGFADRQLVHHALERVAAEVSDTGRRLLELLFVDQLDTGEVAEQTALSPSAVYQWRCRLRRRLREALLVLQADVAGA